ncbi:MAG TPA: AIR synthase-related protein [Bryobacteraceae bacterium]|nr:AIR synthase-related protein [Bryobacteraceae bacterium]
MTAGRVVTGPIRFAGGSIGELAVYGTANRLAVLGARAESVAVTFLLEEGLAADVLDTEVRAMGRAAYTAGIAITGSETKVVASGKVDAMCIVTSGIGRAIPEVQCSGSAVKAGDQILVSGPVGHHGTAILMARSELSSQFGLRSDMRPVIRMVELLAETVSPGLRWMADLAGGGLRMALNDLGKDSGLGVYVFRDRIPVREVVRRACERLQVDPFTMASEGQFLAVVAPEYAELALAAIQGAPGGEEARVIGELR